MMTKDAPSFRPLSKAGWPGIETRLDGLEKQNRRLRQYLLVVSAAAGAVLLLGAARPHRTVEAERFVLRGPDGRVRARLEPSPWGCQLMLYGGSGRPQARLRSKAIGADLTLFDDLTGRESVRLDVAKGEPGLGLYDEKHPRRGLWLMVGPGNGLTLRDAKGRDRLRLLELPTGLELTADGQLLGQHRANR